MTYLRYTQCIFCKQPFSPANVFTAAGSKETQISGLCEVCFDGLFDADEDDYYEQ